MTDPAESPPPSRSYWLDRPGSIDLVYRAVVAVCALLLSLDFFYVKHTELEIERYFGFYGIYGFVCCVFLVLAAKEVRKLLRRDEDYYDR